MKDWNWENKMRQTKNRNHKVYNVYYAEKLTKRSSNILHTALGQLFCVLNRRYLYKIRYVSRAEDLYYLLVKKYPLPFML